MHSPAVQNISFPDEPADRKTRIMYQHEKSALGVCALEGDIKTLFRIDWIFLFVFFSELLQAPGPK